MEENSLSKKTLFVVLVIPFTLLFFFVIFTGDVDQPTEYTITINSPDHINETEAINSHSLNSDTRLLFVQVKNDLRSSMYPTEVGQKIYEFDEQLNVSPVGKEILVEYNGVYYTLHISSERVY